MLFIFCWITASLQIIFQFILKFSCKNRRGKKIADRSMEPRHCRFEVCGEKKRNHCSVFFLFASQMAWPFFPEVFSKSFLFPKKDKDFHRQFCRKLITLSAAELIAYIISNFSFLYWLQADFLKKLLPDLFLSCRKGFAKAQSIMKYKSMSNQAPYKRYTFGTKLLFS